MFQTAKVAGVLRSEKLLFPVDQKSFFTPLYKFSAKTGSLRALTNSVFFRKNGHFEVPFLTFEWMVWVRKPISHKFQAPGNLLVLVICFSHDGFMVFLVQTFFIQKRLFFDLSLWDDVASFLVEWFESKKFFLHFLGLAQFSDCIFNPWKHIFRAKTDGWKYVPKRPLWKLATLGRSGTWLDDAIGTKNLFPRKFNSLAIRWWQPFVFWVIFS